MFSILQKSQETVNAEDLETLQNEIERCLVDIVGQKWCLERELTALENPSPDLTSPSPASSNTNSQNQAQSSTNHHDTKSKDSHRLNQIDNSENSTDGFKSIFGSNSCAPGSTSGTNSTEDSVSSEGSLVSSLTSSTIITNLPDLGSQSQTNNSSGIKRSHKSTNERPSKRFRQNSSNPYSPVPFTKRPPHSKHRYKIVPSKFRNSSDESRPHKKQLQRNDAPDKLWPFVEQFCATPMEEQIKELEEMINSMENDKDYFRIPALGKKDTSSKESPTKSDTPNSKAQRKAKLRSADDEAGLGALTQRLVSSFIDDSNDSTELTSKSSGESQLIKKKNSKNSKANRNIDINSAKNLEKRIRQELEEYNILNQQDIIPYTSEDDEVLKDLVASQHELLSIQRQNKDSMQRLLRKARKHLELEAEREKLRSANADVISAYHRLIQAKQRKRNPTKREKDAAWTALKIQEAIFKKCDDLYLSGLDRGG